MTAQERKELLENKREKHIAVYDWIIDIGLTDTETFILAIMWGFFRDELDIQMGYDYLAARLGKSRKTVIDAVGHLVKLGIVIKKTHEQFASHEANCYKINGAFETDVVYDKKTDCLMCKNYTSTSVKITPVTSVKITPVTSVKITPNNKYNNKYNKKEIQGDFAHAKSEQSLSPSLAYSLKPGAPLAQDFFEEVKKLWNEGPADADTGAVKLPECREQYMTLSSWQLETVCSAKQRYSLDEVKTAIENLYFQHLIRDKLRFVPLYKSMWNFLQNALPVYTNDETFKQHLDWKESVK